MLNLTQNFSLDGRFVCGDKSISHRALILAAVSDGVGAIDNLSLCDDVMSTVECLRVLGAKITIEGRRATVVPIQIANDNVTLNCGNSGTTARLLAGLVCGLGVKATFVGDKSLSARPMDRVIEPLTAMGAHFRLREGVLFETLGGKLSGCTLKSKVNSAQVKSSVLLAAMFAEGETTYNEAVPTRDHTERLMAAFGVDICGTTVKQSRPQKVRITVPNDMSSAAYLFALALLTGKQVTVPNVTINPLRIGFLRVLSRSGAVFIEENRRDVCGEPVADITVMPSCLKPLFADSKDVCDMIDEVPLLAAVAVVTNGTSRFCGVGELRKKESDRVSAMIDLASACGQRAYVEGDDLVVVSDGKPRSNVPFVSSSDHRIVMCQAVLRIVSGGGVVDNWQCVAVSFPEFWQALGINFPRYAVVGANISYSRSPQIMMSFAREYDVAMSYDIVSLDKDVSDDVLLQTLRSYDGANVTIPFKRRVAHLLGAEFASVNTVGRNINPTSTDGYGLVAALDKHGFSYRNRQLWVVGAGGAAEACIAELLKYGARIRLFNRTDLNAKVLRDKYDLTEEIDNPVGILSFVPPCEYELTVPIPSSVKYVFSAAYNDESMLFPRAKTLGIPTLDGKEMLYYQAKKSFDLWKPTITRSAVYK